jgi:hypothetical protein
MSHSRDGAFGELQSETFPRRHFEIRRSPYDGVTEHSFYFQSPSAKKQDRDYAAGQREGP